MILKLKRTPGIYLVGFMGSGKSTVGRALADELGWHFIDLDEEIERQQGCTISSIFDSQGEPAFRKVESEALHKVVRAIQSGRPHVVALGGGAWYWAHSGGDGSPGGGGGGAAADVLDAEDERLVDRELERFDR